MFFLPSHIHYKQLLGAAITKMERNGKVLKYYTFFLKQINKQTSKHLGSALTKSFGETEITMQEIMQKEYQLNFFFVAYSFEIAFYFHSSFCQML